MFKDFSELEAWCREADAGRAGIGMRMAAKDALSIFDDGKDISPDIANMRWWVEQLIIIYVSSGILSPGPNFKKPYADFVAETNNSHPYHRYNFLPILPEFVNVVWHKYDIVRVAKDVGPEIKATPSNGDN